ncbi:hypothetical protein [Arthrobacter sp. EpRS71]|uniref:hypothetical protein n=1 Tax=Arthrobacter sp. EpRS71 TaxID=1743141 RepID=UPI00074A53B1|nr:hypothetical protein [Arthrobacter sp. EpRS71]KUM36236.1 hypothetical protein AR689_20035 [Arthrobacter sp. EpRS71]
MKSKARTTRGLLWVLLLLLLMSITVAFTVSVIDSANWTLTDWGNLAVSLLLGIYFFFLAQHVNRRADTRAEAVANAALITSTGLLAMSSARSLAGSESAALRVAADARAALQHYPLADTKKQEGLEKSVVGAYNDLAFSTFLHSDRLARSVWDRLREGASQVVNETDQLAEGPERDRLSAVAGHVRFVEQLGEAVRRTSGQELEREFLDLWDTTQLKRSRTPDASHNDAGQTIYRLQRFEMLYQTELTVMHDWALLRRRAADLHCEAELTNVANTSDWLAPWYVTRQPDGRLSPVNVMGGDLAERARYDRVEGGDTVPEWPRSLAHGRLPQGLRTAGIDNLCHVVERQPSPKICVLAYEFIDPANGRSQRLVLDGNHRLAAARRLALEKDLSPAAGGPPKDFQVLTFLIKELKPIDDLVSAGSSATPHQWRGFTPDLGLLRGSWRPERSTA